MNKHHNQPGTQLFLRSSLIFSLVIGVGWLTFFFSQQLTGSAVAQPQPALSNNNDIITDTVWTAVNSPYVITSPVTIMPGAVLTVEAGVTVLGAVIDFPLLTVAEEAHLAVQGTAEFPITFTSAANSGPGDWSGVAVFGSVHIEHALFENSLFNFTIAEESGGPVIIANTVLSQSVYGLSIAINALHRLQMTDVAFVDVVNSRVRIDIINYYGPLNNNATLTAHPGLEGYEWGPNEVLEVSAGITLTLEPDVTLFAPEYGVLAVEGHLQAVGTTESPVTFTSAANNGPNDWIGLVMGGSAQIDHALFQNSLFNIDMYGENGGPVNIANTVFSQSGYGLNVDLNALHRLQMADVAFVDVVNSRALIEVIDYDESLSNNATLTAQSGLEGYEWGPVPVLGVPDGITLTLESGVTLMGPENGIVWLNGGHLQAVGTPQMPITFTSASGISGDWDGISVLSGTVHLEQAVLEKGLYNLGLGPTSGSAMLKQSQSTQSTFAPLLVDVAALHHLEMESVHFYDNAVNRVMIDTSLTSPVSDNIHLTAHPGMEGYEWGPNPGLEVPVGITLTVEPGVALLGPEAGVLSVEGHLQANGTLTQPVVFTGVLTGWGGLHLQGSAYLSHTQVSQAQAGGILVDGGQLTAVCSTFSHNQTAGIWVTDNGMPQVTVTAGNLYGNGVAGLQNDHNSPVEAGHNWWGDASGPGGIGPGSGDAVWGEVVYDPWLTQTAVCPLPGDDEPISGLTAVNSSPTLLNQTTYFTATISAGSNVSYTWDFGDGNHGDGPVVTHTYEAAGVYTATVTAGNSAGSTQATTLVTVSAEAPQPDLLIELRVSPPLAQPGETITYTLVLTNSGDVMLHELSSTVGVGSGFGLPHSLAAGVSWSAVYTYTVLAGDLPGPLVNTVSVTAVPPDHDPLTVTTAVSVTLQPGGFLLYLPLIRNNGEAAVGER